jgi:hypothetical protein
LIVVADYGRLQRRLFPTRKQLVADGRVFNLASDGFSSRIGTLVSLAYHAVFDKKIIEFFRITTCKFHLFGFIVPAKVQNQPLIVSINYSHLCTQAALRQSIALALGNGYPNPLDFLGIGNSRKFGAIFDLLIVIIYKNEHLYIVEASNILESRSPPNL